MAKIFGVHIKSPGTNWTAYTPVITNVGTPANVSFFWRRGAQGLEVKGFFNAGTTAPGISTISLPSLPVQLVMDAVKLGTNNTLGNPGTNVGLLFSNANAGYKAQVLTAPATDATVVYLNAIDSSASLIPNGSNVNTFILTGAAVTVSFSLPIVGWSSNDVLRISDDTKV